MILEVTFDQSQFTIKWATVNLYCQLVLQSASLHTIWWISMISELKFHKVKSFDSKQNYRVVKLFDASYIHLQNYCLTLVLEPIYWEKNSAYFFLKAIELANYIRELKFKVISLQGVFLFHVSQLRWLHNNLLLRLNIKYNTCQFNFITK